MFSNVCLAEKISTISGKMGGTSLCRYKGYVYENIISFTISDMFKTRLSDELITFRQISNRVLERYTFDMCHRKLWML